MFTIDGANYNIPCKLSRKADVRSSELSGYLLDGNYFNDAIGTYLTYDITLAIPKGQEGGYASLFEVLSDPVREHSFTMPYGQSTTSFRGRVQSVSDDFYKQEGSTSVWRNIKFSVIATRPSKSASGSASGDDPGSNPSQPVQSDLSMVIGTVTSGSTPQAGLTRNGNVYTLYLTLPKGDKGDKGAKGDPGARGATGATGATGAQGEKGADGAKGQDGVGTLSIGTVTTGAAGSSASASISNSGTAYVLNLTIPRGADGARGADGVQGVDGAPGKNGVGTLAIGTVTAGTTAAATLTEADGAYTINLTLPKGDKGDKGDQGEQGVKGDKGDAGSKITMSAVTLTSGGWSNGVYSLESQFPVANYDIEVIPNGDSINSTQLDAWANAQITGSGTANQLKAMGTVPTTDIPVVVKAVSK